MPLTIEQPIEFVYDDGGRERAGYKGSTGDCVVRSIAIAAGLDYKDVYKELREMTLNCRPLMAKLELKYGPRARDHASPRTGVNKRIYQAYLDNLGWDWHPTMQIGSGCQVHLRADELPSGNLVVRLSKHVTAVIDGALHDTYDCSRFGYRCVYGYFSERGQL